MKKGKKFSYRAVKDGTSWRAEIVRRKTSTENIVSKSQPGFDTEAEALLWGGKELTVFLKNLQEKNKREAEKRKTKGPQDSPASKAATGRNKV